MRQAFLECHVIAEFGELLNLASACGGSDDVRYGVFGPETRLMADLDVATGDLVWVFVRLTTGETICAQTPWSPDVWLQLACHGIQSADCPMEIWMGGARFFRQENVAKVAASFSDERRHHVECNPGSITERGFKLPA